MYCHCTVCGSTFNGAVIKSKYEIPCKCPDYGKKVSGDGIVGIDEFLGIENLEYFVS